MHNVSLFSLLLAYGLLLPLLWQGRRLRAIGGGPASILLGLLFGVASLALFAVSARRDASRPTAALTAAAPTPRYTVTDLGFLPGGSLSVAEDINDRGEIIGVANAADGKYHPFLYADGKLHDLGVPADASGGYVSHINAHGAISGNYVYGEGNGLCGPHRAFRYHDGKVEELPMPPNTLSFHAQGINDAGQIVGFSHFTGDKVHSVVWEPHGVVVPIPGLGDEDNGAFDINDKGQIVGIAGNYGYLADSKGVETLGDLGGGLSIALSVNARSQVAGSSLLADGSIHAFRYQSGKMRDLGTLHGGKGEYSLGSAVSASGDVLGFDVEKVGDGEYKTSAFLWCGGRMIDLNACADAKGWHILRAAAENGAGQIVATGKKNGKYHALLLTPTK